MLSELCTAIKQMVSVHRQLVVSQRNHSGALGDPYSIHLTNMTEHLRGAINGMFLSNETSKLFVLMKASDDAGGIAVLDLGCDSPTTPGVTVARTRVIIVHPQIHVVRFHCPQVPTDTIRLTTSIVQ